MCNIINYTRSRAEFNPVQFTQGPSAGIAFPGPIFKNGDHWDFIGQVISLIDIGCFSSEFFFFFLVYYSFIPFRFS